LRYSFQKHRGENYVKGFHILLNFLDPDPDWIQLGPWQNPDPDPGKQNKEEINVSISECSLWRAGGFSKNLEVLRGGPTRNIPIFFLTLTLFFGYQKSQIRIRIQKKTSICQIRSHCIVESGSASLSCYPVLRIRIRIDFGRLDPGIRI
jgi:hypothetical protein